MLLMSSVLFVAFAPTGGTNVGVGAARSGKPWPEPAVEQAVIGMKEVIAAAHILGDKVAATQGYFDGVFNRYAAGQAGGEVVIEILEVGKPANAPLPVGPVQDGIGVFAPELVGIGQAQQD